MMQEPRTDAGYGCKLKYCKNKAPGMPKDPPPGQDYAYQCTNKHCLLPWWHVVCLHKAGKAAPDDRNGPSSDHWLCPHCKAFKHEQDMQHVRQQQVSWGVGLGAAARRHDHW